MALRTLIVDDEPVARQVLREELEQLDGVEIVSEASNGVEALTEIRQKKPDLVLLDLQMPEMGGFDVVRNLKATGEAPAVVIVTAWDQHAIQAFDAGAIDYLLKPITQERLAEAVDRVSRLRPRAAALQLESLKATAEAQHAGVTRKIVARSGDEYLLLDANEVLAFQAEGEIVWIITEKKRYLATQTLRVLQERLRNSSFRRIHRNALVNVNHVRKMSTMSSQRWLVTLTNNLEFIVSKRQASSVRELLTW
jgi:DNA-binding LytR/AlgR family response regulator